VFALLYGGRAVPFSFGWGTCRCLQPPSTADLLPIATALRECWSLKWKKLLDMAEEWLRLADRAESKSENLTSAT
jgi:hypothetical protein